MILSCNNHLVAVAVGGVVLCLVLPLVSLSLHLLTILQFAIVGRYPDVGGIVVPNTTVFLRNDYEHVLNV